LLPNVDNNTKWSDTIWGVKIIKPYRPIVVTVVSAGVVVAVVLVVVVVFIVVVVHSFIHCRHLYSASSSGATQKRSQPQRGRIMLF